MRKVTCFALILILGLTSCRKESPTFSKDEKKANKQFIVLNTNFSLSVEPMSKKGGAEIKDAASLVTQLTYLVFDNDGKMANHITQNSDAPGFGIFQDSLINGKYTVVVIGSKHSFGVNTRNTPEDDGISGHLPYEDSYWEYSRGLDKLYRTDDTFMGTIPITVSTDNTYSLTLDRIVGRLELNIQDAVPADAGTVTMTFNYENDSYTLKEGIPFGELSDYEPVGVSYTFTSADLGKENFRLGAYILNTARWFEVSIKSYNTSGKLIGEVWLDNVWVYKNKKTVLSGKLFGARNLTNSGTTVGFNDTWATEVVKNF